MYEREVIRVARGPMDAGQSVLIGALGHVLITILTNPEGPMGPLATRITPRSYIFLTCGLFLYKDIVIYLTFLIRA